MRPECQSVFPVGQTEGTGDWINSGVLLENDWVGGRGCLFVLDAWLA